MNSPEIGLLLELILDLKKDIASLQRDMTIVHEQEAKNSIVLEDHARRSTASEDRLELLENRDQRINGFFKISLGILGVVGTIATIYSAWRGH
jgi:hypothetical protein